MADEVLFPALPEQKEPQPEAAPLAPPRLYEPERDSPANEIVVRWNDPALGIDWRVSSPTVSHRDAEAPVLADVRGLPTFGPS